MADKVKPDLKMDVGLLNKPGPFASYFARSTILRVIDEEVAKWDAVQRDIEADCDQERWVLRALRARFEEATDDS